MKKKKEASLKYLYLYKYFVQKNFTELRIQKYYQKSEIFKIS